MLETTQTKKNKFINIDEFDIEDIPFTPLNEGLGFHHGKQEMRNDLHVHKKVYDKVIQKEVVSSNPLVPGELKAFYNKEISREPKVIKNINVFEKAEIEASPIIRFLSFVIDLSVSVMLLGVILSLMFISTTLTFNEYLISLSAGMNIVFPVVLFILIFNIYSLVIGVEQTMGQKILNVKSKITSEHKFSFIFKRTFFELASILTLGVPYLVKLDKKLINNKVIKS